jgi:hypothetical protein
LLIIEGENIVNVEEETTARFNVYPNPATDVLMLQGINLSQVSILDISGKVIENFNSIQQRIDLSQLAPGVYFVQANTGKGMEQRKFIKQ